MADVCCDFSFQIYNFKKFIVFAKAISNHVK